MGLDLEELPQGSHFLSHLLFKEREFKMQRTKLGFVFVFVFPFQFLKETKESDRIQPGQGEPTAPALPAQPPPEKHCSFFCIAIGDACPRPTQSEGHISEFLNDFFLLIKLIFLLLLLLLYCYSHGISFILQRNAIVTPLCLATIFV